MVRDVGSFLLGWGLIYQQALFVDPASVNGTFLWAAVTLILTPVGTETAARIRDAFQRGMSPSDSERRRPVSRSSSRSTSRGDDDED